MRVLLIGTYGFIGSAIARLLVAEGHEVIGFGRSLAAGQRILPGIAWRIGDLNRLKEMADWLPHLDGINAVVNASGALQSGGGDRLHAIQSRSIFRLIEACERAGVSRFVQISAPGATASDSSPFLATKGHADDRLRGSSLRWSILRPGLVIGRNAYGGTLLLRALAALPFGLIMVHGNSRIQTVALENVTAAVSLCLRPDCPTPIEIDLVEREAHSLTEIVTRHRTWLGIAPPRFVIDLPASLACIPSAIADLLGHLGWRSPLRSTAMDMIARDVTGEAWAGQAFLGRPLQSLDETLAQYQAGSQDRWQARLFLCLPIIIAALALLWLSSGIIGLTRMDAVTAELAGTRMPPSMAWMLGWAGGIADTLLGVAILVRRWARPAAIGMILLTLAYLAAGTLLRPDMWIDPLAPLIKAVPAMVLAYVAHILLEER